MDGDGNGDGLAVRVHVNSRSDGHADADITTTTTHAHSQINTKPTWTHPSKDTVQRRQFSIPTGIQDPSLNRLLPGSSPSPSSSASSSNINNNSISTAVVVTIVLSTVAGAVLICLAAVIITVKIRQKRNKPPPLRPPSDITTDHKPASVNASSTILNSPGRLSPFPHLTDMANTIQERDLRAPPRLGDRKFHQTTRSEGSIQMPKKTYTYTRRGKPSSLGHVPSAKDMALYTADTQRIFGATTPKYSIFPKTHKPAASTSTTSTLGPGSRSSPPATPASVPDVVNGLVSPGPPPRRVLPSPPPLKYWQLNPLEGDVPLENVRPEEIGVAIGSPTVDVQEKRERRPRLDERDMERLGGTYSPFKR